jgi:acyl-CoA synthetase (AMP-forming)/AMP-acid ligase II
MYRALAQVAERLPDAPAWEFMGRRATYRQLLDEIDRCAAALSRWA